MGLPSRPVAHAYGTGRRRDERGPSAPPQSGLFRGAGNAAPPASSRFPSRSVPPSARGAPMDEPLRVTLSEDRLAVAPGRSASTVATVYNTSRIIDVYDLAVRG